MKEILIPIAGVIAFIVFVGFLSQKTQNLPLGVNRQAPDKVISVGDTKVTVDLADTPETRQKGLSGRNSLGEYQGMLFVFDQKKVFPSIWMKDMLIPLDLIWISDEKVTKIEADIPAPAEGAPDSNLRVYYPDKPVDYVLEVPAGFAEKNSIKAGDSVDLSSVEL